MHALAYELLVLYCHVTRGPFDPGAGKPLFFSPFRAAFTVSVAFADLPANEG